jgi:hypothetical protein
VGGLRVVDGVGLQRGCLPWGGATSLQPVQQLMRKFDRYSCMPGAYPVEGDAAGPTAPLERRGTRVEDIRRMGGCPYQKGPYREYPFPMSDATSPPPAAPPASAGPAPGVPGDSPEEVAGGGRALTFAHGALQCLPAGTRGGGLPFAGAAARSLLAHRHPMGRCEGPYARG